MNFKRIFANALARRLAALLVAAVLAWLGLGNARAATYADQGAAYRACVAYRPNGYNSNGAGCKLNAAQDTYYWCTGSGLCPYADWGNFVFPKASTCAARANASNLGFTFRAGSTQCVNGCETHWSPNEGGGSTGITSGGVCSPETWTCPQGSEGSAVIPGPNDSQACEPPLPECPEGEEKKDGVCKRKETCPAGQHTNEKGECENDRDTCPAGQTKGPDGSCLDDGCHDSTWTGSDGVSKTIKQVKGKDGTCKADADGDGKADDEQGDDDENKDGKKFSGGDSCDAPPTCSGDAIQCGMARIQWRIDCNTRKDTKVSGGGCDAVPLCTGKNCDAVEYAQLIQQWRTSCAIAKLGNGGGSSDGGQPEWTKVTGMSQNPGAGEGDGDLKAVKEVEVDMDGIDAGLFGSGGGQCPALIDGGGGSGWASKFTAELASPNAVWCRYIGMIKAVLLLSAAVTCAVIISSGGRTA